MSGVCGGAIPPKGDISDRLCFLVESVDVVEEVRFRVSGAETEGLVVSPSVFMLLCVEEPVSSCWRESTTADTSLSLTSGIISASISMSLDISAPFSEVAIIAVRRLSVIPFLVLPAFYHFKI